jgi:hypothetical protein
MKKAGEIVAKFFEMLVSFIGIMLKSSCAIFLGGLLFFAVVFILAIFFNAEVSGAIEIFKNLFKIP